jgi:hypothetical protein
LLVPALPEELVLIRAQPAHRPGVPTTPMEIMNRLNEIACHNVLAAEQVALPPSVRLTSFDADADADAAGAGDAALLGLPISTKFNGEADFLSALFEAGRAAVATQCRMAPARSDVASVAASLPRSASPGQPAQPAEADGAT